MLPSLICVHVVSQEGYACGGGFSVVIDGAYVTEGAFLPEHPLLLREQGLYNKVPELIGVNEDDSSLFVWAAYPGIGDGLNRTTYDEIIAAGTAEVSARFPDREEDVYQAVR